MKNIRKFKVIRGLFYGMVFKGTIVNGRVWNEETNGQSYPIENCEEIQNER